MALEASAQLENNFTRGLITEATGLNFPENACTETYNCVFHQNTKVERRLGIDYEEDHEFDAVTRNTDNWVVEEFMWDDVAGLGNLSFVVIQVGRRIHFWEVSSSGSLSSQKKSFVIDMNDYKAPGAPPVGTKSCQFGFANGHLIVVHPYCQPIDIEYDRDDDDITVTGFNLRVRDLLGLDDDLSDSERPSTLSREHEYNLKNQGWYPSVPVQGENGARQVLDYWASKRNDYPSNTDVWWLLKNSSSLYDLTLINTLPKGASLAPKGHYVITPYYADRTSVSSVPGIAVRTSSYHRPSTIAVHNSRVFYGGISSPKYHNHIFFSQILNENNRFGDCFQDADPTTENTVGLLPTDGGELIITEASQIIKLLPVQGVLLVFCSNGLWAIAGSSQFGFTANDFTIFQVSGVRGLSANSFVIPKDGLPIWWNADGIFTVKFNPQVQNIQQSIEVISLTDTTIKDFYDSIPSSSKRYAKGAYTPLGNLIQWVYRSTEASSSLNNSEYDRVLVLNLNTGAFYPWSIGQVTNGPRVNGIISSRGRGVMSQVENVVDADDNEVRDASNDNVTVETFESVPLSSVFRYTTTILTSGSTYNITFSQEIDEDYLDWFSHNNAGISFDSYLITGYKAHGQAQRKFQANSIFVYVEDQDNSSCFLQGIWDFANDDSSGRYTSAHQVASNRSFYGIQRRRVRLRGRGYSLQLKFFSEEEKPFRLIGWSSFETQPKVPI